MKLSRLILGLLLVCVFAVTWADGRVLGNLGQATGSVLIKSKASDRSATYYRVRPYEYLVVNSYDKAGVWFKVLMSDGRSGYVRSSAVAKLPYQVTSASESPSYSNYGGGSGSAIANYSLKFIGTPYKWGGNDPNAGIDCSGFVKQMYGTIGVSLPRTAAEQALVGQPVTRLEQLVPGDRLYFWENKRQKIGHCGIYLGRGYFVHSSVGKKGVSTDYLTKKWLQILVAARRSVS